MSREGWKTTRLEHVLEALIDYRGKTPQKASQGIPLITAKIVKDGFIQEPDEFIAEENYDAWMVRGFPKMGDVVLTTEAPMGEVAQIDNERVALAQRIVTLRGKKGALDNSFLKYFLMSGVGQARLKEKETGTTVTGIKQSELRLVEIDIPPIDTQRRIATILSALDKKIELNRQTNATLEAVAQALFKEWFVDFRFPSATGEMEDSELGPIPKGWRVGRIRECASKIQYGLTQSASSVEIGPHFLRITDIQNGKIDWDSVPYCSIDVNELPKYRIDNYDVVIARTGASTGESALVINPPPRAVFASYLIRLQFEKAQTAVFIGKLLRTKQYLEFIDSIKSGSAQPNANAQQLSDLVIVIPADEVLAKYFKIVDAIESCKAESQAECACLAKIRDSLLPKLMCGEIEA